MIVMKIRILLSLGLLATLAVGCEDLKFGDDFLEKYTVVRRNERNGVFLYRNRCNRLADYLLNVN